MAELRCRYVHLILAQTSMSDSMQGNFNRRAYVCLRPECWPNLLGQCILGLFDKRSWSAFNKAKHDLTSTFGWKVGYVIYWWKSLWTSVLGQPYGCRQGAGRTWNSRWNGNKSQKLLTKSWWHNCCFSGPKVCPVGTAWRNQRAGRNRIPAISSGHP